VSGAGHTFRELDERLGRPKGSAFRAFKRRLGELSEGEHYVYLAAATASAEIARLRVAGRIYRLSVNVVLLTDAGAERLEAEMTSG